MLNIWDYLLPTQKIDKLLEYDINTLAGWNFTLYCKLSGLIWINNLGLQYLSLLPLVLFWTVQKDPFQKRACGI